MEPFYKSHFTGMVIPNVIMIFSGKIKYTLGIASIYAVAMAYVEATVVVYLRQIFFPQGFKFPLVEIPRDMLLIEAGRELATIIMLIAVAKLLAKNKGTFTAYFLYTFAVWDIGYYMWLKLLLNWPGSILEPDLLFLIPLPWVGPVLAPVLVSAALIAISLTILHFESAEIAFRLSRREWLLEISAGILIILSFIENNYAILLSPALPPYPWWLLITGMILGMAVFFRKVFGVHHNRLKSAGGVGAYRAGGYGDNFLKADKNADRG
jgi:hypothetical protein